MCTVPLIIYIILCCIFVHCIKNDTKNKNVSYLQNSEIFYYKLKTNPAKHCLSERITNINFKLVLDLSKYPVEGNTTDYQSNEIRIFETNIRNIPTIVIFEYHSKDHSEGSITNWYQCCQRWYNCTSFGTISCKKVRWYDAGRFGTILNYCIFIISLFFQ